MCNDRIIPMNDGFESIVFPTQKALLPFFRFLEHKPQPRIVALVFEAGQAVSFALEADATGFSETDTVERLIRAGSELLRQGCIQMLGDPIDTQRDGNGLQGIIGKTVLRT